MPLCVTMQMILLRLDKHQLRQEVHDHSLHFREEKVDRSGQLLRTL